MPNNYASFEFHEAGSMVNKNWFMFPFARDGLYIQEFTENTLYESWLNIVIGKIKEIQHNFFLSFSASNCCFGNIFFFILQSQ